MYKVMEYEIPYIHFLNNDHSNEQSMLCRASASSGEIHIARKNNHMSPILNLRQESCTFY